MKKLLKIFLIEDSTTLFSPILSTDCETKTTVRWIGHRGCAGSLDAMENTINSFKNAAGVDSFGELKLTFIQLWIINLFVSMMQLHFAMNMVIKKEKIYSLTCEQAISKNIMHSKNYPRNHEGYFDPIKKSSLRYEYLVADFEEYLSICLNANKAAVIKIKIGEKYWTQEGCYWNTENINKCMTL